MIAQFVLSLSVFVVLAVAFTAMWFAAQYMVVEMALTLVGAG